MGGEEEEADASGRGMLTRSRQEEENRDKGAKSGRVERGNGSRKGK